MSILGGTVTGDGWYVGGRGEEEDSAGCNCIIENASLRRVEAVMADRRISRKLKGKVMVLCNRSLTVPKWRQQQRLQVCKNNSVRMIAGVKRVKIEGGWMN